MSLWLWHAWSHGEQLFAVARAGGTPGAVQLGGTPSQVIRPALTVASGELDVLLVTSGGKELAMARFARPAGDRAPQGSILWHAPLPGKPVVGRAVLGAAHAHSPRRVLLVYQEKDAAVCHLLDLADGRQPAAPLVARVPGAIVLPGGQPGLYIDDRGDTHAGLLLLADAAGTELLVVDAVFPAAGGLVPQPKVTKARKLPRPAVAGAVAFQARADRPMRRDWAVLLMDGSVSHSQSEAKPMRPTRLTITPMELLVQSQATYLLTAGPDGPWLEALR
jgi:hypothetical protein